MTVRAKTSPENSKTRGDKQYSEVFAIPRVPNVIYTARLDTVPTTTDMVALITVTSGSGTAANIRPDMKMLVGTSAGADDLGFCRVRATPTLPSGAGNVKIGELSHIDWQASCYLTIVDDYDIMPRHLRIVDGEAFIDYEKQYTNQHEVFDPIVLMGGHRVLELNSEAVTHERHIAGSSVFDGSISSILWEAPGASSITGSTTADATFEYDTPGHYVEYLTLTSNDSKVWTGVRYVFVVDPATLVSNIRKPGISESLSGVKATFSMVEDASLSDFRYRAFVILFARDYYGGVLGSIGYNEFEENILASGRISDERITFNDETGNVQFTIQDWKYWLGKISAFPFGLERKSAPAAWTDMIDLNVDRATWALLHEYSTVTRICDLHLSGDTRYAEELASASSTLASQVEEIATTSIFADLVFDRFGSAWLRVEPQLVPESDRSDWAVVMDITPDDYQEGLSIDPTVHEETAQINLSGVSVSRHGAGTPHFSLSYGRIPAIYGDLSTSGNLLLESQSQSNSLSGLAMGWDNRRFDSVSIEFVGNERMFSIAEYCRAAIDIEASANPRGVAYDGYLVPREIFYQWDENSGLITTSIEFQDESVEQINVTGDFPEETEMDDDFSFEPPPSFPIPSFPPIALFPPTQAGFVPSNVVIITSQGVFYTTKFNEESPEWLSMNNGIDPDELSDIEKLVVTPSGAVYIKTSTTGKIYRAGGIGGTFRMIASYETLYGDSDYYIFGLDVNPIAADEIAVVGVEAYTVPSLGYLFKSTGGGAFSKGSGSMQFYTSGGDVDYTFVFYNNFWYCFFSSYGLFSSLFCAKFTAGGAVSSYAIVGSVIGQAANSVYAVQAGNTLFQWDAYAPAGCQIVSPSALTFARHTFSPNEKWQGVSFSPTGAFGMGSVRTTFEAHLTSDGGVTWVSVGGVVPNGSDIWENVRNDYGWIFGGGMTIRFTPDRGASYIDKAGNLLLIAPLVDVKGIRFIS